MANRTYTKQELVDAVTERLLSDISQSDLTVLDELLNLIPVSNLINSLPEEEGNKWLGKSLSE